MVTQACKQHWGGWGRRTAKSSKPAWATLWIQGQSEIHNDILFGTKQQKEKKKWSIEPIMMIISSKLSLCQSLTSPSIIKSKWLFTLQSCFSLIGDLNHMVRIWSWFPQNLLFLKNSLLTLQVTHSNWDYAKTETAITGVQFYPAMYGLISEVNLQ